ncbi:hypothetical protein GQ651_04355 [Alphaproteobacteria bacterium GH1-50]|uniref:Uncharacterized protein n=1 Tax=Kangsaoukella pontilimi TaxID=2691042 RepID=A0A7C9MBU7_9RHOB|nr:hypothetical protein [Kangsaoukella pontilimi]MXQ07071.1 hypothetical protein [Kangsaoukella pontilimi]
MRVVAILAALGAFPVTSHAQDAVVFLGSFDTVGSDVSVTPLDEQRLEFCWTTTSRQSACQTFVYAVDAGVARFASFADGRFEFDLVTNVLTQTRPDGAVKSADMTPLAR